MIQNVVENAGKKTWQTHTTSCKLSLSCVWLDSFSKIKWNRMWNRKQGDYINLSNRIYIS